MVENFGLQDNIYIYVYLYLFIILVGLIIKNKKCLISNVYRCLIVNAFLAFAIMAMSYCLNITSFMCISFTLPVLVVFFLFHYNAYDTKTGSLDLKAFKSYIDELGHKKFIVLSLYLKKDLLDKNERLSQNFITYIQDTFTSKTDYGLFRVSNHHFILVYTLHEASEANLGLIQMKIRYGLNWLYNTHSVPY